MNDDEPLWVLSFHYGSLECALYLTKSEGLAYLDTFESPARPEIMRMEGICEHPDRAPKISIIRTESVHGMVLVRC